MDLYMFILSVFIFSITSLVSAQSHPFLVEFFDRPSCLGDIVKSEYLGFQNINQCHDTNPAYASVRITDIAKDVFRRNVAVRLRQSECRKGTYDADFQDVELLEDESRNCTSYNGVSYEVLVLKSPSPAPKDEVKRSRENKNLDFVV